MILELKIKNFLSFKDEVVFSFEATKDKTFEDYQVVEVAPNIRILKLAIIYGANASGKSNLLNAFEFLRNFWLQISENKDDETGVIPFLLDKTLTRALVDADTKSVKCEKSLSVMISISCDKRDLKYCFKPKEGCEELRKIYANRLELAHFSMLEKNINCYFAKSLGDKINELE